MSGDGVTSTVKGPTVFDRLKTIAGTRPIPQDRIEAALFGYSEEEWQAMVELVNKAVKS